MRRKKRHINKRIISNLFKNTIINKCVGAILIALTSYIINHIQTSNTISQLKVDNKDLSWAVDYFRQ